MIISLDSFDPLSQKVSWPNGRGFCYQPGEVHELLSIKQLSLNNLGVEFNTSALLDPSIHLMNR